MKIRDSKDRINGITKLVDYPNGIEIVAEDDRTIFGIRLEADGITLTVHAGNWHWTDNKLMDDTFVIRPRTANTVELVKVPYVEHGEEVTRTVTGKE